MKAAAKKDSKLQLDAKKRDVFGKKLKKVRIGGMLPGNIFGPDFKSQSITVNVKEFRRIYNTAKETGVVYIKTDDKETPVLIRGVQKHPVTNLLLHVDFAFLHGHLRAFDECQHHGQGICLLDPCSGRNDRQALVLFYGRLHDVGQ